MKERKIPYKPKSKSPGRPPTKFTSELMEKIIHRVASGETLTAICRDPGMPHPTTFRKWVIENEGLHDAWLKAKELRAHAIFDEMIDIAREIREGTPTAVAVNAARLTVETLRHAAARLNPKEYGERVEKNTVVPIQIITSLDLGQGGQAKFVAADKIFTIDLEAEQPTELKALPSD